MKQLLVKNDDSSLCYDVIITHQKKINKFCSFSSDIEYNSKTDAFRVVIYLIINQCEPRPPADTKCPPAAQPKQTKRACSLQKVMPANRLLPWMKRGETLILLSIKQLWF